MIKRTMKFGIYTYDLRTVKGSKKSANHLASAIRSSGKKARVVPVSSGYAVYVK